MSSRETRQESPCYPSASGLQNALLHQAYIAFMVVGLINNTVSLLVFFDKRYDNSLFSLLMRCFYMSNIFAVFMVPTDVLTDSYCVTTVTLSKCLNGLATISLDMSYTMLALMGLLRFFYSAYPSSAPHLTKIGRQVVVVHVLVILTFIIGKNVKHLFISKAYALTETMENERIFIFSMMSVNVFFNIVAIVTEKRRPRSWTLSNATKSKMLSKIHRYLIISTVCSILTTLPFVTFPVVPAWFAPVQPLTDDYCVGFFILNKCLILVLYVNVCVDNTLYCMLSREYRAEMKAAMWGCVPCGCCEKDYITSTSTTTGLPILFDFKQKLQAS